MCSCVCVSVRATARGNRQARERMRPENARHERALRFLRSVSLTRQIPAFPAILHLCVREWCSSRQMQNEGKSVFGGESILNVGKLVPV